MKVTAMYCPGTDPSRKQPAKCAGVTYPVKGTIVTAAGVLEPAYVDGEEAVALSNHTVAVSPTASVTGDGAIYPGNQATSAAVKAVYGSFLAVFILGVFL